VHIAEPGDLIITLGAGSIATLGARILEQLEQLEQLEARS
jgi:UDP-N-acetylmuramate-alanine ligase